MFGSLLFNCSYLLGTFLVYLSLLIRVSYLLLHLQATSDFRASQVYREIMCRFIEYWWLFGGDRVSIPRALVAIWRRSCVDLGAALGLFMRSCVDLRTAFGLLKELNLVE